MVKAQPLDGISGIEWKVDVVGTLIPGKQFPTALYR